MTHELFIIDRKPALDKHDEHRAEALREKLETAKSLGLTAQAASVMAELTTIERGALIMTPPMTETELVIWRAWLPTVYTETGDNNTNHKLASYQFDRIPSPVLKMWQKYKESGLFERFEIWTPEIPRPDPILVGVNGNARYMLARWGESDCNLVSFDDIKRELVRRWHKNEPIGGEDFSTNYSRTGRSLHAFVLAGMATVVAMFSLMGLTHLLRLQGPLAATANVVSIGVIAIGAFIYARRYMTDKLWKSNAVMQAIIKDDSHGRERIPT